MVPLGIRTKNRPRGRKNDSRSAGVAQNSSSSGGCSAVAVLGAYECPTPSAESETANPESIRVVRLIKAHLEAMRDSINASQDRIESMIEKAEDSIDEEVSNEYSNLLLWAGRTEVYVDLLETHRKRIKNTRNHWAQFLTDLSELISQEQRRCLDESVSEEKLKILWRATQAHKALNKRRERIADQARLSVALYFGSTNQHIALKSDQLTLFGYERGRIFSYLQAIRDSLPFSQNVGTIGEAIRHIEPPESYRNYVTNFVTSYGAVKMSFRCIELYKLFPPNAEPVESTDSLAIEEELTHEAKSMARILAVRDELTKLQSQAHDDPLAPPETLASAVMCNKDAIFRCVERGLELLQERLVPETVQWWISAMEDVRNRLKHYLYRLLILDERSREMQERDRPDFLTATQTFKRAVELLVKTEKQIERTQRLYPTTYLTMKVKHEKALARLQKHIAQTEARMRSPEPAPRP